MFRPTPRFPQPGFTYVLPAEFPSAAECSHLQPAGPRLATWRRRAREDALFWSLILGPAVLLVLVSTVFFGRLDWIVLVAGGLLSVGAYGLLGRVMKGALDRLIG